MTMSDRSDPSEKSGCPADVDADAAVKLVQKAVGVTRERRYMLDSECSQRQIP